MTGFSVKKVYFYLISFISLLLLLFNTQALLTTTLQHFVFKSAPQSLWQPPFLPFIYPGFYGGPQPIDIKSPSLVQDEKTNNAILDQLKNGEVLSVDQKNQIDQWFRDYNMWKEEQENQQKGVLNSLIGNLVGAILFAPIFFWHFKKAREN